MPFAYAGYYADSITNPSGVPLGGLAITVYVADTLTVATLYTDRTKFTTAANPTATDALGNLLFYADPGLYDLHTPAGYILTIAVVPDSADLGGGGGGAVASVFGRSGVVVAQTGDYTAAQVGADPAGAAAAAQAAAIAASDPAGAASAALTAAIAASLQRASNLGDLTNAGTARTNLGLGSAATHPATDFDPAGSAAAALTAAEGYTDNAVAGLDTTVVHKTGAESVGGVKTFTSIPVFGVGGTVIGNLLVEDNATPTATFRMTPTGATPGVQSGASDLYLSTWTATSFSGTQRIYARFEQALQQMHLVGKVLIDTGAAGAGVIIADPTAGTLTLPKLIASAGTDITAEDPITIKFIRTVFNAAGSNLWECRVNGQLVGYANEGGELRARGYLGTRVSFRTQSHVSGDGTTVHVFEVALSDNTPQFYVTAQGDAALVRDLLVGRNLAVTTGITIAGVAVGALASTTPTAVTTGAGAVGVGVTAARADHSHPMALVPTDIPDRWTMNLISGAWWRVPDIGGSAAINPGVAGVANFICVIPARNCTLAGILAEITTGDSSGTVRFGLASDSSGQPGSWTNDFGTAVATAIAVIQPGGAVSVALTAGTRYWVGVVPQATTTGLAMRGTTTGVRNVPVSLSATPTALNIVSNVYRSTGWTGALTGAITGLTTNSGPAVAVKLT